jgi:hypothetical protein
MHAQAESLGLPLVHVEITGVPSYKVGLCALALVP